MAGISWLAVTIGTTLHPNLNSLALRIEATDTGQYRLTEKSPSLTTSNPTVIEMTFNSFSLSAALSAIVLLTGFVQSNAQNLITESYLYRFNAEGGRPYDNTLVSDGTYLYDVLLDGGINGGGSIFRVKPDGSGYTTLFNFQTSSTGLNPVGTLVLEGNMLYGMTLFGGTNNVGVIYKIATDGTGFQLLLNFNGINGALPYASLIISGSTLYGITQYGGVNGEGLIFKLQTDGSGYQTLLVFDGTNGGAPTGMLTLSDSTLFGMTVRGGNNDLGVVFAVNTDGTGYRNLVNFDHNTGTSPFGSLTLSGTTLYGTTNQSVSDPPASLFLPGTLFKVETDGTKFEVIYSFSLTEGTNPWGKQLLIGSRLFGMTINGGDGGVIYSIGTDGNNYTVLHSFTRTEGRNPLSSLTMVDSMLYSHTSGGANGYGVIFRMNQDGSGFQKLKDFEATNMGYEPAGGLVLTKGYGFGVTNRGGQFNQGVIYKVNSHGTGYTVLHNFDGDNGAMPGITMTLSGSSLYGTTSEGGATGTGTLFKIDTTGNNFEKLVDFTGDNGSFPVGSLADDGAHTVYGMTGANSTNNKGTVFKFDKATKTLTTLYSFESTDAITPYGEIILANSMLYGMCLGGTAGGVVFSLNTDGSGFTKILDRSAEDAGRYPNSLTVSGTTLYGSMSQGGTTDVGTVFKVQTDGTGFQRLVNFSYNNGAIPTGELILIGDSILYGMTKVGGPHDSGVAYSVRTDGSGYTILLNFDDLNTPIGGRVQSSGRPLTVQGSLAFKNGSFYTPLTLESGNYRTAGVITFTPAGTHVVTGLDAQFRDAAVYPNPTAGVVKLSDNSPTLQGYIVDAMGQTMHTVTAEGDSLDVSQLPKGMYFLVVGSRRYRFIKI